MKKEKLVTADQRRHLNAKVSIAAIAAKWRMT
jgi:hypothetical protein